MNLFDRIPSGVFNALTGKNNRRAWDLIVRLYDQYFGPDAIPDYPEGYLRDRLVKEIERFLLDAGWENESDETEPPATPLNVQANQLLDRLVETGWLVDERVGLRTFINMSPTVSRLFDLLYQFSTEGPQLLGGNVLLIFNQLKGVMQDPRGQVSGFISAARLCVQLIHSLSATTLRVRDLMKDLTHEEATPIFVRRFFSEHIGEIYVRDFKNLRTDNHPLRLRFEIISMVNRLCMEDSLRESLLSGYAEIPGARPGEEEEALERDRRRFMQLLDVEKFLERMDQVIDAATQRAIAYLGYRLKASERIEEVLAGTVEVVCKTHAAGLLLEGQLLSPDTLASEERLRMPIPPPPRPNRTPIKQREMTIEEKARRELRRAMLQHREMTPTAMRRYVAAYIPHGATVSAENLVIEKVEDAVAFLSLSRLASISSHHPKSVKNNPLLRDMDFKISLTADSRVDNPYFNAPHFTITRES